MKKDEKLVLWADLQGVVPGTSDPGFYHDILEP